MKIANKKIVGKTGNLPTIWNMPQILVAKITVEMFVKNRTTKLKIKVIVLP